VTAIFRAWPAMALAVLILAPFLSSPFTIDDPIYLREAQHALIDPLHPQAFSMVWSTDLNLRASQILPGGIAVPYLLIPAALAGCAEWAAHLTQLVLLLIAIYGTALLSLRLGLDSASARWAALLTATCPAVLGMAGTVMPDVAAMAFTVLGMERIVACRGDRRSTQALAASLWLALAALTRAHTILVLAPAFVLLLDGLEPDQIQSSFRNFPARFLPVILTPLLFLLVSAVITDPESESANILSSMLQTRAGSVGIFIRNLCAFLTHFLLVIPLTIPWLILRGRHLSRPLLAIAAIFAVAFYSRVGPAAFAAGATLLVLGDILLDALERLDRLQLALWLWLLLALPVVVYIHLPSKYLLPCVPAAVILVIRLAAANRAPVRWLLPAVSAAGAVLGLLILLAARDLAETQRRAATDLIAPHAKIFERVWCSGHWGFQWYAEKAGAHPVTLEPPLPQPGDIIVVSQIDLARFPRTWQSKQVLQHVTYPNAYGRVMDLQAGAGFFSSVWGFLPWVPGSGDANTFEVWRVN
jgi:hypothetical protein